MRIKNKPQLPLGVLVDARLRRFTVVSGFAVSLVAALIVGVMALSNKSAHQVEILSAIARNVTSLAQNSDDREIERVFQSFVQASPGSELKLVSNGVTRVSVPNIQDAQTRFAAPKALHIFGNTIGRNGNLYSSVDLVDTVTGEKLGFVTLATPGLSGYLAALMAFGVSFSFVAFLLSYWRMRSAQIVAAALTSLETLQKDLVAVGRGLAPSTYPNDFEVEEFAQISALTSQQHKDIMELTREVARSEGNARAKEAIHALLHDLVNVYTAQSTLIQARIQNPSDERTAQRVAERWPELNRQLKEILKSARHMEIESPEMSDADLAQTVAEGASIGAATAPSVLALQSHDTALIARHDAGLIKRAVANLVRNSVEENASRVKVWIDASPLAIHIEDNGPGVDQSKVSELFEGRAKSTKPEGSGTGFRTSLRLIQAHKGTITLEPTTHTCSGAHFKIDLSSLEKRV
ncbi:MAG: sensor histidine kinase [Bdellovibrionales bacterium]|nr:sensor histidine kinase [Bdellovibrionales bacterium]